MKAALSRGIGSRDEPASVQSHAFGTSAGSAVCARDVGAADRLFVECVTQTSRTSNTKIGDLKAAYSSASSIK